MTQRRRRHVPAFGPVLWLLLGALCLKLSSHEAWLMTGSGAFRISPTRQQEHARRSDSVCRRVVEPCKSLQFLDDAIASTATGQPNVLVVSFSTTWCGPCKLMDPKVTELSEIFKEKAKFIKVMGDKAETDGIQIMKREGVRTVPLYQIYKDGQKVGSVSGADPESLTKNLEKFTGLSVR